MQKIMTQPKTFSPWSKLKVCGWVSVEENQLYRVKIVNGTWLMISGR